MQDITEGNYNITENSFVVLASDNLLDIAVKMGIHQEEFSFENIDILKDLEVARAALNKPVADVTHEIEVLGG